MSDSLLDGDYEYLEYEIDSLQAGSNMGGSAVTSRNWPLFKLNRPLNNIAAVKVLACELPVSYYVFNSTNNTFQVEHPASTFYTITIPVGNYTAATFPGVLETQLEAATGGNWTITIDAATQKLSVAHNNGNWRFIFGTSTDTGATNPRLFMGYNPGQNTFTAGTGATLAPYVINLSGPNYLLLNSNRLGPICDVYLPQTAVYAGNISPVLAKIPVSENTGNVSYWTDPCPEKWFSIENLYNITDMDFYFTWPPSNTIVDFNGAGFSLKLGLIIKSNTHAQNLAGSFLQNRVVKRIRPN